MSIIKRKVNFYKLSIEKRDDSNKSKFLSEKEIESLFKSVYKKMKQVKNKNAKVYPISYLNSMYIIEVVQYDMKTAIVKIGKQNPSDTVALRDFKTYQSTDVPMSKTQNLELFTYCMFDFETCIISYISIGFSPKISLLQEFINENVDKSKYYAQISAILCDDVISLISKKNLIGDLTLSVAVPSDKVLSDEIGLSMDDFDDIFVNNIKYTTMTLKLAGYRNKSLFKNKSFISKIIDNIYRKFGSNVKTLKISAKNNDEKKQEFDILSYKFCKTVDLYDNKKEKLNEKTIINLLKSTYNDNKEELIKYSRVNYD